jgi:predicted TIM-barrel fold metal-dependent hydrolase
MDDKLRPYAQQNHLEYNLDELLTLMKKNGVRRGLLLGSLLERGEFLGAGEVLRLCEKSGGMLLPVLTVVATSKSVRDSIKIAREHAGYVKAFKIMLGYGEVFAADPVYAALYTLAEKEGLPVMFHTGDTATSSGSLMHSHPLTLDPVANVHPDLKMVACQCGNPWIQETAELIYKHANVYADISGLAIGGGKYANRYLGSLVRKLNDAIFYAGGTDKLLFGTDYPVETYSTALELVKRLDIDQPDREKILSKNAERVFTL